MDRQGTVLDISAVEQHAPVYRIISLRRLYELFRDRRNVLVSPSMWEDPFENFILKSQRISRRGWFGQCWTRYKASDAMWRIYSSDAKGIRIRSTPARLLGGLAQATTRGHAFIGSVRYLARRPLLRFAQKAIRAGHLDVAAEAARTLLVKRPAFRHEAEIRLLFSRKVQGSSFSYRVHPHLLLDQLMLDPRLSPAEFEVVRAEIRSKTGYAGPIKRSLLYAPPPELIGGPTSLGTVSPSKRLQPAAGVIMGRRG